MSDVLHIDLETRSAADLKKTGVYTYAADPTTDVWCACYAFGDGPILTWRPGDPVPDDIVEHVLLDGQIFAHNSSFERTLWRYILTPRYGWPAPRIEQFRCTMVMSYAMGMPGSLEMAAPAAGLDIAKDMAGRRLMLQMSRPRKVTDDGKITWWDDPERVGRLVDYCKNDVEVERALEKRLRPLSKSELALWHLDQKVNDRGILVDQQLANAAKDIVAAAEERLNRRMRAVTNHEVLACSNRNQIMAYIGARGVTAESIAKDQLEELLAVDSGIPDDVREVLTLRREAAKASVAKIDTLLRGASPEDSRAKGLLQFYGAATGRWCIAEGTPVLVRRGGAVTEVPIESVHLTDEVWDGDEWVRHEGVVFSGYKNTTEHDGLRATPEHVVYLADDRAVSLGEAKEMGAELWRGRRSPI